MKSFYQKLLHFLSKNLKKKEKYQGEVNFWRSVLEDYVLWYTGKKTLYSEKPPKNHQKIKGFSLRDSAILTWGKVHQEKKYLQDLNLKSHAFRGKTLLDIGSGPHPSALCFKGIDLYCLDPLLPEYIKIGFPIHYYQKVKFIHGKSEKIPIPSNYFDVIISVNAIDHVDDIEITAKEMKRVLKKNGHLRLHIHYHKATQTEPIELNDKIVSKLFKWCKGFHKVSEHKEKRGHILEDKSEKYALWSNF